MWGCQNCKRVLAFNVWFWCVMKYSPCSTEGVIQSEVKWLKCRCAEQKWADDTAGVSACKPHPKTQITVWLNYPIHCFCMHSLASYAFTFSLLISLSASMCVCVSVRVYVNCIGVCFPGLKLSGGNAATRAEIQDEMRSLVCVLIGCRDEGRFQSQFLPDSQSTNTPPQGSAEGYNRMPKRGRERIWIDVSCLDI